MLLTTGEVGPPPSQPGFKHKVVPRKERRTKSNNNNKKNNLFLELIAR